MLKTITILIFILLLVIGVYLIANKYSINVTPRQSGLTLQPIQNDEQEQETADEYDPTAPTPTPAIVRDGAWYTYTNPSKVYSIRVPATIYAQNASCEYVTKDGDDSYRPKGDYVPTQIIEGDGVTLITPEYLSVLGDSEHVDGGRTYFKTCEKISISDQSIRNVDLLQNWTLRYFVINNDKDLDVLIKNTYGEGCSLGEKTPSDQSGTYDVSIKGDGLELGESKCPINFMYVLKYSPAKKMVVNWDRGQSCYYPSNPQWDCYDDQMESSFKFLP